MFSLCDDIKQTDLVKSWVEELTSLTPQQVETVIQELQAREMKQAASLT